LAWDIRANILNRRAALADETFASFLNYCRDPHGSNCALMIGSQALINFKQCSGFALDLQSLPTSSPTAIPTPGGSTTAPTTTPTRASNNTNVTSKSRLIKDYLASLFSILVVTALL
jgi:hypothetical protein